MVLGLAAYESSSEGSDADCADYYGDTGGGGGSGSDAGHVRGGWAGHVCLPVSGRSGEQLRALGRACAAALAGARGAALAEPHISLTRAFYVQEHQIAGFVRALEAEVAGIGEFAVAFGGLSAYRSEVRGGRAFVAADVAQGAAAVDRVRAAVDRVMARFGQRPFFARARFHASLARADLDGPAARRAGDALGAQLGEEILQLAAARIDAVQCAFGDRRFVLALGQAPRR
ncbi:hypothetical protein H4R18_001027 [Coemansia javaensis]|uniref:U6 snRNA phosphodiesterase 1 n=1 Tax=Coemansia javaensis TaxID=2761396 RepID=A0A9W8HMP3_9FUNG|nr:hypothetical protein H4R18_001027 [Coemansia javaensis]